VIVRSAVPPVQSCWTAPASSHARKRYRESGPNGSVDSAWSVCSVPGYQSKAAGTPNHPLSTHTRPAAGDRVIVYRTVGWEAWRTVTGTLGNGKMGRASWRARGCGRGG